MSFLKSFTINGTEFVAQTATDLLMPKANDGDPDVTVAEAVAAVQDKLAGYEEIVLQMDDGTNKNNVDKLILAKQHYIYYDLFAWQSQGNRLGTKSGAYDANYNYLGPLEQDYTGWWDETEAAASEFDICGWTYESEFGEWVCTHIFMDKILAKYPTATGIKLDNFSMIEANAIKNAEPNQLDWICLVPSGISRQNLYDYDNDGTPQFNGAPYLSPIQAPLCSVSDFVSTIYVEQGKAQEAPWGTNATVEHNGLIPIT